MRTFDFSSWQGLLSTFFGLAVITLIGVGIRILVMQTIQQRRARENRQINERLRMLIAAYKTLGGSFTGDLAVDPRHLRDLRRSGESAGGLKTEAATGADDRPSADRTRRMRDAVEAALSDVILLGTEEQVQLAAKAASELVAGRSVHIAELVVSLRDFIRQVLDLEPVPAQLSIPRQGPTRPAATRGKGDGNTKASAKQGEGQGMGGGGSTGAGVGFGGFATGGEQDPHR